MNDIPTHDIEHLDWQAYRYVAGEMSSSESATFERLLEYDFTACLAVERAVELYATLAAAQTERISPAMSVSPASLQANPVRIKFAVSSAIAASLFVGWFAFRVVNDRSDRALADAWSRSFEQEGNLESLSNVGEPNDDPERNLAAFIGVEESESESSTWMIEALRLRSDRTDDEEMES